MADSFRVISLWYAVAEGREMLLDRIGTWWSAFGSHAAMVAGVRVFLTWSMVRDGWLPAFENQLGSDAEARVFLTW